MTVASVTQTEWDQLKDAVLAKHIGLLAVTNVIGSVIIRQNEEFKKFEENTVKAMVTLKKRN